MQPANPYISCLVEASAGSGKTHQLSERFLSLVASGADPSKILTITFTIKAAAEMRARILGKAMGLALVPENQKAFEEQMSGFKRESGRIDLPQIRSAKKTGEAVLAESQALRISTIDSLFLEWVQKFPDESGVNRDAELGDKAKLSMLKRRAWEKTLINPEVAADLRYLLDLEQDSSIDKIFNSVDNLNRFENGIFLFKNNALSLWDVETIPLSDLFAELKSHLQTITSCFQKFATEINEAIHECSLSKLMACKLLTKGATISRTFVKGKKRELLSDSISAVERILHDYLVGQILADHNEQSVRYFRIWEAFSKEYQLLKSSKKLTEFSDLAKGVYKIFNGEESVGVTWLIQQGVNHLLIDEFQDTSRLQWNIFESLSRELLSGQNPLDTVFIVGDRKQSIYGFREADPAVLDDAGRLIADQLGHVISLSKSYRSSPAILQAVNDLLGDRLEKYPLHEAATDGTRLVTPEVGGVWCLDNNKTNELEMVADTIKSMLSQSERFPVGKGTDPSGLRPLQPGDIAVLYRSGSHADGLEALLRARGIACMKEEKKGFFSRSEILDLKFLLQWFAFPHDEYSLLAFLSGPIGGFTGDDYESIFISESPNRVKEYLAEEKHDLWKDLVEFKSKVDTLPLEVFLLELWQHFKIPDTYRKAYGGSEGALASQNLEKFLMMSAAFKGRLADFLLKIEESIKLDEDGNAASESCDAVHMMTIHKSKGLEFAAVFVLGLGKEWESDKDRWVKDETGRIRYLPLKGSLAKMKTIGEILPFHVAQSAAEVNRLLYVALTRASQYLVLSHGSEAAGEGKDKDKDKDKDDDEDNQKESSSSGVGAGDAFFASGRLPRFDEDMLRTRKNFWQDQPAAGQHFPLEQREVLEPQALVSRILEPKLLHPIKREIAITSPSRDFSISKDHGDENSIVDDKNLSMVNSDGSGQLSAERIQEHGVEGVTLEGVKSKTVTKKPLSEELSASAGIFFHKAMEIYIRDGAVCDLEELWDEMIDQDTHHNKTRKAYIEMVNLTCQSADFKRLFQGAQKLRTEASYGRLEGSALERGTMDLVIEYPDEVIVLDYKTSAVDETTDLRENARQSGYQRQIEFYRKTLEKLYPSKKIRGLLWYAQVSKLLEI